MLASNKSLTRMATQPLSCFGRQLEIKKPVPSHLPRRLVTTLVAMFVSAHAYADTAEQEAIQAQLASALASADYAARKCPNLVVDHGRIEAILKRSGKTIAELKSSEDYTDQRDVILSMEKGEQANLICFALSQAHGGYGRGVINEK